MTISPHENVRMNEAAIERSRRSEPKSDIYRSARPVVLWILGSLGGSALLIAGAAHRTLWDHDGAIKVQGEWQKLHTDQARKDETRIDDRLKTIEVKIDRLIELRMGRMNP